MSAGRLLVGLIVAVLQPTGRWSHLYHETKELEGCTCLWHITVNFGQNIDLRDLDQLLSGGLIASAQA